MNNKPGIILKKPVALGAREINVKWRDFGVGIFKTGAKVFTAKLDEIPENLIDIGAAVGIAQQPGEIAYVLVISALTKAIFNLIEDNRDLLQEGSQENEFDQNWEKYLNQCLEKLELEKIEVEEITINHTFFLHPQDFILIKNTKVTFSHCLQAEFHLQPEQAEIISNRLPQEFFYALYSEFQEHSDKYAQLQTELENPFSQAAEKLEEQKLSWQRYSAWLQKQVEERMFLEAFGLKQVYVPLRAFYEEKQELEDDDFSGYNRRYQSVDKSIKRYVINLEDELQNWLDKSDQNDAMRVISGGPGSGKSSFAKMWAATLASTGKIPVLFIPLHLFNPEDDLVAAIGKFIESMRDIPLPPNPLKPENFVDKLLIIFDGLDELAMQGKIAEEVARRFIGEVRSQLNKFNTAQTRLMVLISGREIAVQRNQSEFRKPKSILHVLPYFIIEYRQFIDSKKLLEEDQRNTWWKYYGEAKNCDYKKLPDELNQGNFQEITAQPLLNYLIALTYDRDAVKFTKNSNLNEIYAYLISKVYQRVWGNNQNPQIQGVEEKDFLRILESIAIAAWHGGDIRVTTLSEIEEYCDSKIIDRILDIFKQDKKASFTRLLTAFYFRQHGVKNRENTFEFTHKSFGEYLAAKCIVRQLNLIHQELQRNQEYSGSGWDEKQALEKWAKICGLTAMDKYIFDFIINEIRLQQDNNNVDVGAWQQTMCDLISYVLKYGMPMERLSIPTFQEANRQARNAEEALLAVLNACARVTEKLSQIKWPSLDNKGENSQENKYPDFGNWISRLRGQRVNFDDVFCLKCLSFLDLQNCVLIFQDFYRSSLSRVNLADANLSGTNLSGTNLSGANLSRANLSGVNLSRANLSRANLRKANLIGANLSISNFVLASLIEASLIEASLIEADLIGAILVGTDFSKASLFNASLFNANLIGTSFIEANLFGAIFREEHIQNVNFEGAKNVEQIRIQVKDGRILPYTNNEDLD